MLDSTNVTSFDFINELHGHLILLTLSVYLVLYEADFLHSYRPPVERNVYICCGLLAQCLTWALGLNI